MDRRPFFAEIIESALHQYKAQTWQWDNFPECGSLVVVEQNPYIFYGIVSSIQTGSIDPTRYPFPYQKTEEELRREQPQIFEFLRTVFTCITVGYANQSNELRYQILPQPPKIHAFVRPASAQERTLFFNNNLYLHLLFNCADQEISITELALAVLSRTEHAPLLSAEKLDAFIELFYFLSGNDYRKLKLFLQRLGALTNLNEKAHHSTLEKTVDQNKESHGI